MRILMSVREPSGESRLNCLSRAVRNGSGGALRRGETGRTDNRSAWRFATAESMCPAVVFLLLSLIFGPLIIAVTPPMRGPDEPAHFIRAYGLSQGQIIPSLVDADGRRGIFIPASLQRQMVGFDQARKKLKDPDLSYPDVFARDARLRRETSAAEREQKVFARYDGTEAYSPVPYLPYLPAVAVARLLELDFLATIYLMRATGFLLLTALMAYAIALAPRLQWSFLLIAMLPSSLFARATLSSDGASLTLAMLVTAVSLRSALSMPAGNVWARSLWMSLCALAKPPQIAFALLELMRWPSGRNARGWAAAATVMMPALALPVAWAVVSGADIAVSRMIAGTGLPAEHYDPIWKLRFMIEHPRHFPRLLYLSMFDVYYYWEQLIGVLGWLDAPLQPWLYPLLTACLVAVLAAPLGGDPATRLRIGCVAAVSVIGYCLAVFMIFYLVWTRIDDWHIYGVQGRYFVPVLPVVAIAVSALLNRGLPQAVQAWIAVVAATVSGGAVVEAVLAADWKFSLPSF